METRHQLELAQEDLNGIFHNRRINTAGSAIFIGNKTLLTAAHVVADMDLNDMCTIKFEDPNNPDALPIFAEAELMAKANMWEMSHGGVSGRTAQQFINYLAGKGEC